MTSLMSSIVKCHCQFLGNRFFAQETITLLAMKELFYTLYEVQINIFKKKKKYKTLLFPLPQKKKKKTEQDLSKQK